MSRNEVFAISNKPGEVTLKGFNYLQSTLRAWYDGLKEKLLDFISGGIDILEVIFIATYVISDIHGNAKCYIHGW